MQCWYCERIFEGEGNHPGELHDEGCPASGQDSRGSVYPNGTGKHYDHSVGRLWGLWGWAVVEGASASFLLGYRQGEELRQLRLAMLHS